ncbi:hypothetical protein Ahy_A01g004658 [Arachis hypogaea]|uniref:Transposase MuDR plant domain-containing protein n=1 Tax=Arachis hypogaea TaxID=3818 RepID=A0A445EWP7_ARAHY|nr:hypothetical protein Ahy_A01g004658 [Arachis hypogaea]
MFQQFGESEIFFGNIHKHIRSITLNHIGPERIREKLIPLFEEMILNTFHQWSTQTSIDVKQSITKMNFQFFAKFFFGYDIENLPRNTERISEELFTNFTEGLKTIPLNIPGTNYHKCLEEWKKAIKIVKNILEARRNSPEKYRGDILDQAINDLEKNKVMNDDQIVFVILGIWFASSASISSIIQLIFKFLSDHPCVIEELRGEHEDILRSRDKSSSSLTWKEYKSMKFTQQNFISALFSGSTKARHLASATLARSIRSERDSVSKVLNETLRFSTLLPGLLRIALKDIHFDGGQKSKEEKLFEIQFWDLRMNFTSRFGRTALIASSSPYIVVLVYPNYHTRNDDNGITFECEDPILFHTQRVQGNIVGFKEFDIEQAGGTELREIRRVAYRLLASIASNGAFCRGGTQWWWSFRSGDKDEDECVPETPVPTVARHVLPPPLPTIPALSGVPSHYHSLDLDAMHERTPFLDMGEEDYNLDGCVEFRVSYKFRSREVVFQGVKNYSIRRSAEYRVIESDRLKYHVQCRQVENGCQWSLRVVIRQNIGYWEVQRVGGVHSYLAPTMS